MNIIAEINALKEQVNRNRLLEGPGYRTEINGPGTRLFIERENTPEDSDGGSAYSGPFAVIKKNDTTVTVILDADDATYFQDAKVIAGLVETDAGTDADVTITVSGVVYADVTYSSGWVVAFANAAAKPAQTTDHIYIELAQVVFTDSKIVTIRQTHEGQIFPTQWGRVG